MPYVTSIEQIGIEKGIQKGIQQGIQKGILQTARKSVIQALEIRFGEIPQPLAAAIDKIDDPSRLEMLHKKAITIKSIEKFEQILTPPFEGG